MRLHQHCAIAPWERHGVVAHVDLTATQQHLATNLQAFIQDGQQEDSDTRRDHLWLDNQKRVKLKAPQLNIKTTKTDLQASWWPVRWTAAPRYGSQSRRSSPGQQLKPFSMFC